VFVLVLQNSATEMGLFFVSGHQKFGQ